MKYPLQSLQESRWFKLICGASFQHLPAVRSLTLAYGLAGADCIDVAADPAVVSAARDGLAALRSLQAKTVSTTYNGTVPAAVSPPIPSSGTEPWLMVSLNDGDDPHFRKAAFDPKFCPPDCPRPCEAICPTHAIVFADAATHAVGNGAIPLGFSQTSHAAAINAGGSGVVSDRCYGCGRCVPICPLDRIQTQSYTVPAATVVPELLPLVDAVEIHTQVGRTAEFERLWQQIAPHLQSLKLVAVSCPDGDGFVDYLRSLHSIMTAQGRQPLPCPLLWQTDGRPMSGDIGKGTTRATIRLAQRAIAANLPGFVQLAGGTNAHTVPRLKTLGLLPHPAIAGVAYGSYARTLLDPVLEMLEQRHAAQADRTNLTLELEPDLLLRAVELAQTLVTPLKSSSPWTLDADYCRDGVRHFPLPTATTAP